MKLRFTALALALAAASPFAATSRAQEPYQWKPAVVSHRTTSAARTPAHLPTTGPAVSGGPTAATAASAASYSVSQAAYASIGEDSYASAPPSYGGCSCGGMACGGCGGRGLLSDRFPVYGLWGDVEYMFAWTKGRTVPPLVTTDDPAAPIPGSLPGATVLFGGERIGEDMQSAGRITLGAWLDSCETIGIGVRGFAIEGATDGFFGQSDQNGTPLLAVPFFDVAAIPTPAEGAILIASPGDFEGNIAVRTAQDVISTDTFLRTMLVRGHGYSLDLIGGYHYAQVRDAVQIESFSEVINPAGVGIFPEGTTFDTVDNFSARNDFHGGEIGFISELRHGRWRFRSLGKVSIGNMEQTVTISGRTVTTIDPNVAVDENGVFAQTSNIGTFKRDETTFIPEAALTLGYQVTPHLEMTVGYSLLYWESVVLSGDSIDRRIDLTQAGGGPAGTLPEFNFNETDFWVQGLTLGAHWNF